jgi:hypothetical protein
MNDHFLSFNLSVNQVGWITYSLISAFPIDTPSSVRVIDNSRSRQRLKRSLSEKEREREREIEREEVIETEGNRGGERK